MTSTNTTAVKPPRTKKTFDHQDLLKRHLVIGDVVAFSDHKTQFVGVVSRMTEKMVHVNSVPPSKDWRGQPRVFRRYPSEIVKLEGKHVTAYLIAHSS